jgi:hypothetical protein
MMYRKEASVKVMAGKPLTWNITLPLIIMTSLVILLGFFPSLMNWLTVPAADRFIHMFGY